MLITANDIHTLHRPSVCQRRIYLFANRPELAAEPSEYDHLIMQRGLEHEQQHLSMFPSFEKPDYPIGDLKAGADATRVLIEQKTPVIYQGVVCSATDDVAGIPDYLILVDDDYVIRDAKLAVNLNDHPEIPLQLSLYIKAFRDSFGKLPQGVEVLLGNNTIQPIDTSDIDGIASTLIALKKAPREPDESIGWTKCSPCAFREHCWGKAAKNHDPGLVSGIDQNLRHVLVDAGVNTHDKVARMSTARLAEIRRPWGKRIQRVGEKRAERIIRQSKAMLTGRHNVFETPVFPTDRPCAYFDIESDPHDELLENKVYLWALLIDRADGFKMEYTGSVAPDGESGDEQGWLEFLRRCESILDVGRRLTRDDVLHRLAELFTRRGVPDHIRSDNGPEFTAKAVREWLERLGVKTLYIETRQSLGKRLYRVVQRQAAGRIARQRAL